ncbi:MAG TPA: hypothetical protein VMD74_02550 [Candidatus Methylomirabilis sp.]|nr:hypothetical protein [Candidatus Methylomirabilis sp.]
MKKVIIVSGVARHSTSLTDPAALEKYEKLVAKLNEELRDSAAVETIKDIDNFQIFDGAVIIFISYALLSQALHFSLHHDSAKFIVLAGTSTEVLTDFSQTGCNLFIIKKDSPDWMKEIREIVGSSP